MKAISKYLEILIILFATQSTFAFASTAGYVIDGHISGKTTGMKVYLKSGDKTSIVDSTFIKNGVFQFKGKIDYPWLYNIVIQKNKYPRKKGIPNYQPIIPIFLENGTIKISADLDSIPEEDYTQKGDYNYNGITFTGDFLNRRYRSLMTNYGMRRAKWLAVDEEYYKYYYPEKGLTRGPVLDGVKIVAEEQKAINEQSSYVKKFILENANNVLGLFAAQNFSYTFTKQAMDSIISAFPKQVLENKIGQKFLAKAEVYRNSAVGAHYSDLNFADDKGNPVKLSEKIKQGRYTLLEFWASWCGPCREGIPYLKQVYNLYHAQGFDIISVSMDSKKSEWLKATAAEKMPWLQVSELKAFNGPASKLYNFKGIPTVLMIDPNGIIVSRDMRGSWLNKKLIEVYGDKFEKAQKD